MHAVTKKYVNLDSSLTPHSAHIPVYWGQRKTFRSIGNILYFIKDLFQTCKYTINIFKIRNSIFLRFKLETASLFGFFRDN